jgi:hypothetical protein
MNNLCCLARHVIENPFGAGESTKQYAIDVANKYGVDVNDLRQQISKQLKGS